MLHTSLCKNYFYKNHRGLNLQKIKKVIRIMATLSFLAPKNSLQDSGVHQNVRDIPIAGDKLDVITCIRYTFCLRPILFLNFDTYLPPGILRTVCEFFEAKNTDFSVKTVCIVSAEP